MISHKLAIIATGALSLCTSLDAGAYCVESGADGSLTAGTVDAASCSSLFDDLVTTTQSEGKGIELFIAQRESGYYYKICNSPAMKSHFKAKFGIAKVKPSCETLCLSADQLAEKYCDSDKGIRGYQYQGQGDGCMKVKVCAYRKN